MSCHMGAGMQATATQTMTMTIEYSSATRRRLTMAEQEQQTAEACIITTGLQTRNQTNNTKPQYAYPQKYKRPQA